MERQNQSRSYGRSGSYGRGAASTGNRRSRPYNGGGNNRSRSRNGGGGFRSKGRGGGRRAGKQQIDIARFINRAEPAAEVKAYEPQHKFADFALDARLKSNIATKGYVDPTPIQDQIIKHVLEGKDVVGIANTGTGKTAAFLLPLIDKVLNNPKERVMVITPTRELAQQIEQELISFTKGLRIFATSCVGGAPIGRQISRLKRHNHFVIGTPGRLKDLVERRVLSLNGFNTLVLDEADRMLDMGFIDDMKQIMAGMPKERHTLFFSATMSKEITALISTFLKEPVTVSVKTGDTSKQVDQDVVRTRGADKLDVLHDLLNQSDFERVLVFGETKRGVEKLSALLTKRGIRAEAIHGNKSQSQRERALKKFKDGHAKVLVATDVAARGLDINNVSHVINYDTPQTYDDYVHRIGRTGRAGKTGKALTFIG
ncbi:MAG: DEAD/DEAH box helicase [Candidatus Paceibacterota bacterium]